MFIMKSRYLVGYQKNKVKQIYLSWVIVEFSFLLKGIYDKDSSYANYITHQEFLKRTII